MGAAVPSGQFPVIGFRVLGPLEVGVGARVAALGGPRVRAVLALLLADAGRVVSVAALVDGLWGGQAPPDAEQTVRSYVSRLRRALLSATVGTVEGLLVTRPPGYLLRLDPDALDADRFERLAVAGRWALDAGRPADAAQTLATALGLWRGEAYGEFDDIVALRGEGARLEQLRLTATADRIAADLAVGLGDELIAELDALTEANPRHERLWGQLMTALYRAGRQADALEAFVRARRVLIAESGVEPSPELAEVHRRVLAHDPRLLAARPAAAPAAGSPAAARVRPAQLPPAVAGFTGRESELAALDGALDGALDREAARPVAVVISAVSGTAGVGKTALAVHWAHRVADRFPDGQLYVNLRGFDPGGQAMDPAEAVRGFLDALGVPPGQLPPSLQGQVGLYRTLLAGKRMLVVLDNARDAEQVRPLLPGSPTAMAVVTSRSQLTGLVAANGATPLTLDIMSTAEAREMLARRLGRAQVAAEPSAVEEIITRCARLPLALSITAARAQQSSFPLASLVAQLASAGGRLDALDAGDPPTQVRAVFSWSHAALTAPAARLFRLLGLCPGTDTSAAAAASLAGLPPATVRPLLAELVRASLLSEPSPGRYTFHDLLRAYAAELTDQLDTAEDRRRATHRLLDHCLHTAYAAARLLDSHRDPIPVPLPAPAPGVQLERLADQPAAMAWLVAEHAVLLAALQQAADSGLDAHAWQLAWTLDTFLTRRGPWQNLADAWQIALPAAGRLGNPAARAHAHRLLARARTLQGRYADAHRHHEHALDLFAGAGDQVGQAHTHNDLAYLCELEGQPEQALDQDLRALALYQAAGHRRGQANALNAVGWYHAQLGDHAQALARCREALALHQQLGNRFGEAHTWDSLGYAHHQLAGYPEAADCYQRAADMFRELGSRYEEATTLRRLGDARHDGGDADAARAAWQRALDILTDLDHADAAAVLAKLKPAGQQAARPVPASAAKE